MRGNWTAGERAQVAFIAAECYCDLGMWHEALTDYEILALQYRLLLESLADADCPSPLTAPGATGKGVQPLEGVGTGLDRGLTQCSAARRPLDALGRALPCHRVLGH